MYILEHFFCNGTDNTLFSPVRIKFSFSYLSIAFYCGQKLVTKNRFYDRRSV